MSIQLFFAIERAPLEFAKTVTIPFFFLYTNLDALVELKFVSSKGEAKRLIQGGGVKLDGKKITDMAYTFNITEPVILQAGKRKFAKLII